jgi:hypothetical protein
MQIDITYIKAEDIIDVQRNGSTLFRITGECINSLIFNHQLNMVQLTEVINKDSNLDDETLKAVTEKLNSYVNENYPI